MPYGLDDHGRYIFLISSMAMHTQNLQADTRASLLVTAPDGGGDALGAARITLVGNVQAIPQTAVPEARNPTSLATSIGSIGLILKIFLLPDECGGRLLRGRLRSDGLGICVGL
jgi:Pyridoxamine 5'-phosphate oxidase